jgi:hypothetical protein
MKWLVLFQTLCAHSFIHSVDLISSIKAISCKQSQATILLIEPGLLIARVAANIASARDAPTLIVPFAGMKTRSFIGPAQLETDLMMEQSGTPTQRKRAIPYWLMHFFLGN